MGILYIFVIFIHVQAVIGHGEKRILLNDPDVLLSQIHDLERKYQDVLSKYSDLSRKFSGLATQYSDISTKYTELVAKTTDFGVFVRWGRKDCPSENNTELVYSGFAGGSWYAHSGAAAEFVCLPPDPNLTTKFTTSNAFMHGAEYDSTDFGHNNGDDLPCVVCRRTTQSSVLMIPGMNNCYTGWTEQYRGYLAAGQYNDAAATQYICLDEHSDALQAGERNDNGKFVHPVKAVCGALACPPYHNNTYLSFVVCTK
ncbi:short-chain collagen C4-like [Saccostrea echinata]|uniref:short-chain collagen C4-like n=1 Tax=Saccostrea echinata TaxID=191078 RepID=UPI002A807D1C|nr:short-chain collagen C4-like [Saccostrea echinata]